MEPEKKMALREEVLSSLHRMEASGRLDDDLIYQTIDKVILKSGRSQPGTLEEKRRLRRELFDSIRGLDVLEPYLKDDCVSEIMVVGADKIFIERDGRVLRTGDRFADDREVIRTIEQIVGPANRIVNESNPFVDARLADGSRVHIVLPPVSLQGPVITIRKFLKGGMSIDRLIRFREFPASLAPVLRVLVKARFNILVSGATNSGKSSLLNALAEYIGASERIITIEDSAELQFFHVDNLVRMETRNANVEGRGQISMNDLIKASLRMRPDRIIVGEVRGAEAVAMLQALSTGHSGSFSTIHANSCRDALRRLETMVLMGGLDMPLRAVQGIVGSSVEILIHIGRQRDGLRRILEICELLRFEGEDYRINPLFTYEEDENEGQLKPCGRVVRKEKLISYGQYEEYENAMADMEAESVPDS